MKIIFRQTTLTASCSATGSKVSLSKNKRYLARAGTTTTFGPRLLHTPEWLPQLMVLVRKCFKWLFGSIFGYLVWWWIIKILSWYTQKTVWVSVTCIWFSYIHLSTTVQSTFVRITLQREKDLEIQWRISVIETCKAACYLVYLIFSPVPGPWCWRTKYTAVESWYWHSEDRKITSTLFFCFYLFKKLTFCF